MFTRTMCPLLVGALLFSTPVLAAGPIADRVEPLGQASAQQTAPGTLGRSRAGSEPCEPFFRVTTNNRSLLHVFVDQALESLPHLYPKHVLLLQRRYSEIGEVVA